MDGELGSFLSTRFTGIYLYKRRISQSDNYVDQSHLHFGKQSAVACNIEFIEGLVSFSFVPCIKSFQTIIAEYGLP